MTRRYQPDRVPGWVATGAIFTLVLLGVVIATQPAAAHPGDDEAGAASDTCGFEHPDWRNATAIDGVRLQADRSCRPDNPHRVATFVKGTNNVGMETLMRSGLARDAVVKGNDRDGDGDPDEINITLEVTGVNEYNRSGSSHQIAPGVNPPMWTFSPKGRGMVESGSKADALTETTSPSIRVEEGDTVTVTVENTHYMPHTIHFHGVDHPYERTDGQGNEGVPQTSEQPIQPGERRTYEFTPEQAGAMFYHCHVVPNVHVEMGLNGQFIVEENRSDNAVQTLNLGAGKVRHPSKATLGEYAAEYDLQYQALDKDLADLADQYNDPKRLAKAFNREYDATDASMDYFLLNGESFPYTLHDSMVIVEPDERYKLHVSNTGPGTVSLHTHGHKFNVTARDGVRVPEGQQPKRDVVSVTPAQRVTLALNTTEDGLNSYGPGVWFMHDHREKAVTTDGVSPGGGITMITYESYLDEATGMPRTNTDLGRYFNASYYAGDAPVFRDPLYRNRSTSTLSASAVNYGVHDRHGHRDAMDMEMVSNGTVVNEVTNVSETACSEIRGTRNVTVHGGSEYAAEGEVYGYSQRTFEFEPCTKVTVTFVNHDDVRHQWMVHGLPKAAYGMGMFNLETAGTGSVTGTFITPPGSEVLTLHCSLPQHEHKGMHGEIVVGDPKQETSGGQALTSSEGTGDLSGTTLIGAAVVAFVIAGLAGRRYR